MIQEEYLKLILKKSVGDKNIEITQRAELTTCGLSEIIHGATCLFVALLYARFILKYPYEKNEQTYEKKDKVMVWDSNPHVCIQSTVGYPLGY